VIVYKFRLFPTPTQERTLNKTLETCRRLYNLMLADRMENHRGFFEQKRALTVVRKGDPRGTSQKCSRCRQILKKDLSVRVHECPSCGLVMDRDVNGARNILQAVRNWSVWRSHLYLSSEGG